jgi:CTP synthase (UTP-ammonia lyase)
VTPLACALLGEALPVHITPGSRAYSLYGRGEAIEEFWCSYGLAADYQNALTDAGFIVSGVDASGAARIVESFAHPFFVATLFLPQKRSAPGRPHPILEGFAEVLNRNSQTR